MLKRYTQFKIGLQFFGEGDPDPNPNPAPEPKTFSADYVGTLREEAKENRIARKAAETKAAATEAKFKKLLGLAETDELDDAKITNYQSEQTKAQTAAIQKANDRLLQAEIKGMAGYDAKLIDRLLDRSKVTIDDAGNITGLKEAVTELEKEFPAIKTTNQPGSPANPPLPGTKTAAEEYNDALIAAQKNPQDSFLRHQVFIAKEKLNKK